MTTLAQQPELYTVTQACALVKGKTSNIYTVNRYTLRIAHSFGMFWKQHGFRTSATATAKSFQLCPTLCNLIDSSPSGSPVPGILQARTPEWVAISFSNA